MCFKEDKEENTAIVFKNKEVRRLDNGGTKGQRGTIGNKPTFFFNFIKPLKLEYLNIEMCDHCEIWNIIK